MRHHPNNRYPNDVYDVKQLFDITVKHSQTTYTKRYENGAITVDIHESPTHVEHRQNITHVGDPRKRHPHARTL